jgi:hypothetical protein
VTHASLQLATLSGPLEDADFPPGTRVPIVACPQQEVFFPGQARLLRVPKEWAVAALEFTAGQRVQLVALFRPAASGSENPLGVLAHVRGSAATGDWVVLDLAPQSRVRRRGAELRLLGYTPGEDAAKLALIREEALAFLLHAERVAASVGRDISEDVRRAREQTDAGELIDIVSEHIPPQSWKERAAIQEAVSLDDRAEIARGVWAAERAVFARETEV